MKKFLRKVCICGIFICSATIVVLFAWWMFTNIYRFMLVVILCILSTILGYDWLADKEDYIDF